MNDIDRNRIVRKACLLLGAAEIIRAFAERPILYKKELEDALQELHSRTAELEHLINTRL